TDQLPARRAAGAFVLGRAVPEQRLAVNRLLSDTDAKVRFRAAVGLVRAGDKSAVGPLLAMLSDGPLFLARQAEDLLFRIAADKAPRVSLGQGEEAVRRQCRETWETWWKEHSAQIDLAKVHFEELLLGLNLVCDCDLVARSSIGRLWECGADGKLLWKIDDI